MARIKILSLLVCFFLAPVAGHSQEEEDFIRLSFRTLGWNVQSVLSTSHGGPPVSVYQSQFDGPYLYYGPRIINFYRKDIVVADGFNPLDSAEDEESQSTSDVPAPPPIVARVSIPRGMTEALLIVAPSEAKDSYPYSIAVVDDAEAVVDRPNVHFYNVTGRELIVNIFDRTVAVQPRQQEIWLAEKNLSSPLRIAVRTPQAKIVYTSRFRLRANERLVFFARQKGALDAECYPEIRITSLLESVQETKTPDWVTEPPPEPAETD